MKKIFSRVLTIFQRVPMPLNLLALCVLAYGLLIPWQGFYLDDWYIVLYQKYFGAGDFSQFFAQDRPLFGYVYQVFVPLFRDSRLAWQGFALFAHALAASMFWGLLIKLFPARRKLAAVAAMLFAVYPGFQFHWFSVMYSQVFMMLSVFFLSYILMIESLKPGRGRVWFMLAALVCQVVSIVPQETFIGLEVIRPVVLGMFIWQQHSMRSARLRKTLLAWMPYLAVLLGFVAYRLGTADQFSYKVSLFSELTSTPVPTLLRLASEAFWASVDSVLTAWVALVNLLKRDLLTTVSMAMLAVMAVAAVCAFLALRSRPEDERSQQRNGWLIGFSLLAILGAMAPFIAGSFKVTLDFPNNRYLIALAPPACLLLATLVDGLFQTRNQKLVLFTVLIGLAVGSQFITARSYMLTWQAQQDFFWQLTWRAPGLQPNTLLVSDDIPFSRYYSGPSLTAPLNLTFAPESNSHEIPYLLLLVSQQEDDLPELVAGTPIEYSFRSFAFNGNTSDMVVFKKPADGCLRVYSPEDSTREFLYSPRSHFWLSAIPLSNLERIISNPETPATPAPEYFGTENRDQWCYFFEKADLARQQQNWTETVSIYEEAASAGFKPLMDAEWLPLVDAYLKLGEVEKAVEITHMVENKDQTNTAGFCSLWQAALTDQSVTPFAQESISWLNCRE